MHSDGIRERFLDERSYVATKAFWLDEAIPQLRAELSSEEVHEDSIGYALHDLGSKFMDLSILLYSGGVNIPEMAPPISEAIDAFDKNLDLSNPAVVYVDLAVQTYYVEALWLLSLTALLGLGNEQIERVASFYATDETNDGADELFELILAKLGRKSFEAEGVIHEDPYQLLLDCVKAEPADRPALMTKFLERWFKGQKDCDWWGSHIPRKGTTVLDTGFFGYWAFEAALVTFLWDIDDTSYRDLPHYPKDLADYARHNASTSAEGAPERVAGGKSCPREGFWFTPARQESRRRFERGETMPVVGGDYGATIWQWDEQQ